MVQSDLAPLSRMATQVFAKEDLPDSSLVYAGDKATLFKANVPVPRLGFWLVGLRRAVQCRVPLFKQGVLQIVQHGPADAP